METERDAPRSDGEHDPESLKEVRLPSHSGEAKATQTTNSSQAREAQADQSRWPLTIRETSMQLSTTNSTIKPSSTERNQRRRTGALLLPIDDEIGDLISVASIREQARMFGIDRVRGL
jgi:hypothetical protein